jgi:putative resolvase
MIHLSTYIQRSGWHLLKTYQDIGSGLNDERKGLLRLLRDLPLLQPDKIVCTYEDRLARFGTKLLETICTYFSTKIVVIQQQRQPPSLEEQVVHDVIALITSFAGKLHRARRGQLVGKTG